MIDHFSLSVKDFNSSLEFYDKTLETLGYSRVMTLDMPENGLKCAGYGKDGKPSFWIGDMGRDDETIGQAKWVHVAFQAPDDAAIRAWYKKCLELGGTDNGAPGPRLEYHPGYYGAFVVDPSGWRIEAAFHGYQPK